MTDHTCSGDPDCYVCSHLAAGFVTAETTQQRADREVRERLNEPQNLHVLSVNAGYRAMLAAGRRWSEADAAGQNVDPSWVDP